MLSQHLELFTALPYYALLLFIIVLFYRTTIIMSFFLNIVLTIASLNTPGSFTVFYTNKKGKKLALV
jgi:hypothetical protein